MIKWKVQCLSANYGRINKGQTFLNKTKFTLIKLNWWKKLINIQSSSSSIQRKFKVKIVYFHLKTMRVQAQAHFEQYQIPRLECKILEKTSLNLENKLLSYKERDQTNK